MDLELLISAIEQNDILWDPLHSYYRDNVKTHNGWVNVARILDKDFDSRTEELQKSKLQEIQKEWKTMKDNFRSHGPRSSAQLVFLSNHHKRRRQDTQEQECMLPPKRQKKRDVEEALIDFMQHNMKEKDEMSPFFESILPRVKNLSPIKKVQFKIKVLQILEDLMKD